MRGDHSNAPIFPASLDQRIAAAYIMAQKANYLPILWQIQDMAKTEAPARTRTVWKNSA
jgi:hypothetical protein